LRGTLQTPNRFSSLIASIVFVSTAVVLSCACSLDAPAEPIPVHYQQGAVHGLLELRSVDGQVLASGDSTQVAHGDQVTSRVLFHFKDGSIDDQTTVYSQHRSFRLISDHRIQKGPFFPHPMDVFIDARKNQVTVRSTGKDGKDEVNSQHLDLPPDLANGMVPVLVGNIAPGAKQTIVPMLVATPKPRLVKLVISPHGEESFSVAGTSRQCIHYEIKIDLGGAAAMAAPLVGKQPPNIQLWIIGGEAPTFLREQGPIYPEGPLLSIRLASPVWPDSSEQNK
jgi:hypothetical protein